MRDRSGANQRDQLADRLRRKYAELCGCDLVTVLDWDQLQLDECERWRAMADTAGTAS